MTDATALQIASTDAERPLRPEQKRFNTLLRQIDQARKTLADWQEAILLYGQRHAQSHVPLLHELQVLQRDWAFALDAALARKGWTRAERETLTELLCDAAGELLSVDDGDKALKALFDKHSDVDFDTDRTEGLQAIKEMAEWATGLDLGDDEGIATEEDLLQRMQQRMQAAQAEQAEREAEAPRRRKSAAEQRREAEAQQATQSVREIYRKLASALHPDRESDDQQRAQKTALMQQVNHAYEKNDLLTLLQLQLQIEQVDAAQLGAADAKRVKHYNKVLAEQLAELKAEINRVELGFRINFRLEPGWGLKPTKLGEQAARETQRLRAELAEVKRDIGRLDDVPATKRWLKKLRLQREEEEAFDLDFDPFF